MCTRQSLHNIICPTDPHLAHITHSSWDPDSCLMSSNVNDVPVPNTAIIPPHTKNALSCCPSEPLPMPTTLCGIASVLCLLCSRAAITIHPTCGQASSCPFRVNSGYPGMRWNSSHNDSIAPIFEASAVATTSLNASLSLEISSAVLLLLREQANPPPANQEWI